MKRRLTSLCAFGLLVWMAVAPVEEKAEVHLLALGGAGESHSLSQLAAQLQEGLADAG